LVDITRDGETHTHSFDADSVTFGRDKAADFVLDHRTVSRKHAKIVRDPLGGYRLEVLSKGGLTVVDKKRVEGGDVRLYSGASLLFGEVELVFRLEEPARRAAPAPTPEPEPAPAPSAPAGGGAIGFGPAPTSEEVAEGIGGEAASQWEKYADEREAELNDGEVEEVEEKSAFERMEEAAAKSREQSINPVLVVSVVLAACFLGYTLIVPAETNGPIKIEPKDTLKPGDPFPVQVKCLSKDDCLEKALEAYRIGKDNYNMKSVHVANLFDSYKKMLEVEEYLATEELEAPAELEGLEEQKQKAREELDEIFRNYRVAYKSREKNEMYRDMASALHAIKTYFPDKAAPEYRWAESRIVELRAQGNYYTY
jgi:pSer/pThr/pTyr-binding forkhead associated (FHA) protein/DNA-binding NarL/FixJ family response regulator